MSNWIYKTDFDNKHINVINNVFAALPSNIAKNINYNKNPTEIWEKEETKRYAFFWKSDQTKKEGISESWYVGIIQVLDNEKLKFERCNKENDFDSDFLKKYKNIESINFPEWNECTNFSEEEHAAVFEIVRAALPTDIARNSENNGCPHEIWVRNKSTIHAFIWKTLKINHDTNHISWYIGLVNISSETGIEFKTINIENEFTRDFLNKFSGLKLVDFTDQFWSEKEQTTRESSKELTPENEHQKPTDIRTQIQEAKSLIDHGRQLDIVTRKPKKNEWKIVDTKHKKQVLCKAFANINISNFTLEEDKLEKFVISVRKLPFYKNFNLYRIFDQRRPHCLFTYLVIDNNGTDACLLGTSSPPIHSFNKRRKNNNELNIDRESAVDYLKFFCRFVHGNEGAFPIIESQKDLKWIDKTQTPSKFEEHGNKIKPNHVKKETIHELEVVKLYPLDKIDQKYTSCRAFCGYGRGLFIAEFKIMHDGTIEMIEDTPCYNGELPIEPLSFNSEYQFILMRNNLNFTH